MKIIHFSDLHLGIDNHGSLDPATGLSTRVLDFLRSFDAIVDRAIGDDFDAVLFTGDAFKNRDPSPTLQREFARRVLRLAQANVPIAILVGNHDLPNMASRATPVELYKVLEIPRVHVSRNIESFVLDTKSGPLQIVALPWITRSLLLNLEMHRHMTDEELDRRQRQVVSELVSEELEHIDSSLPSILMAHVSLQGATLGYEQSIMLGRDVTVGRDDLHARGFDYVALGHIHKHQVIGTHPPVVYAGSPERVDFGEEHEPKGYVEVEIDTTGPERETSFTFVALPARRFETIRIKAGGDTPDRVVMHELSRDAERIRDAVVRCIVQVDPGREGSVSAVEIRRALQAAGAFSVAYVTIESDTVSRARAELDEEIARDAATMLGRWLEQKQYDAKLKTRVKSMGLEMITQHRQETEGRGESG
ncbi:MAG: exonuclease SbcCD subunit D [Thermomicrobiales bacterium]|nr:exonuclease SbcCD subunit D [Thermomicrobiales bacterium]